MASRPEPQVDVLIMAAHALELGPLRAALLELGPLRAALLELGPLRAAFDADFRAVSAPALRGGASVCLSEVGVGAMLAGAGAMRCLLETRPRVALLVGSCGVYPGRVYPSGGFEPGQLMLPSRVVALDAAVLEARAAFPAPMPIAAEPDAELTRALAAAAQSYAENAGSAAPPIVATLATTLAITTDDALATRIARDGDCAAENLEALAVALACRAQGVTFGAVLGVTNEVGSRGRAQWREHHALAAQNTANCVLAWLKAGGR